MLAVLAGTSWCSLMSRLSAQSGLVLSPTSPGYEERRKVMNAACTAQPAVIVVPNTERDISVLLEVARLEGLEVSVRSGGHSYTCTNIKEGGLHIDMRNFDQLEMVRTAQSDTGLALKLGPGRIWGDVLDFAPPERSEWSPPQSSVLSPLSSPESQMLLCDAIKIQLKARIKPPSQRGLLRLFLCLCAAIDSYFS